MCLFIASPPYTIDNIANFVQTLKIIYYTRPIYDYYAMYYLLSNLSNSKIQCSLKTDLSTYIILQTSLNISQLIPFYQRTKLKWAINKPRVHSSKAKK